jgi:hypothetical protein
MGIRIELGANPFDGLPLFNPREADQIIDDWSEMVMDHYARDGLAEIGRWMDQFFKEPTPYYETQVTVDAAFRNRVIHDRGIVYGPWLDGSGTRNKTSRFKGYPHWRRTVQYLQGTAGQRIIEAHGPELALALVGF